MKSPVPHVITVLVADDHPLFRSGLLQAIEGDKTLKVVCQAGDGETALGQITELRPDIAVLDVGMPRLDGLKVARALKQQRSPTRIIFLTMHNEEDMFNKAMDAGAQGYVLKESAIQDILQALHTVAAGKYYLSPAISHYLVNRSARHHLLKKREPGLDDLTVAERRVLQLIAGDKTTKEIADELGVSPRTIDAHRQNICDKLDLHGSHSLLKFAFDHRAEL